RRRRALEEGRRAQEFRHRARVGAGQGAAPAQERLRAMRRAATACALLAALALAGCGDDLPETATLDGGTAVLGGNGGQPALADARGRGIPPPPVSAGVQAQAVRSGDDSALAVWLHEGRVLSS